MANNIPSPPRLTGNPTSDISAMAQWMKAVHEVLVLQGQFVDAADQFVAGEFDAASLPDPASTNIATAQQTANEAYQAAVQGIAIAGNATDVLSLFGTVTISGTATSAAVTFEEELTSASYEVLACGNTSSGSPAAEAFVVTQISAKATTGFIVHIHTAPGTGKSVTMAWCIRLVVS